MSFLSHMIGAIASFNSQFGVSDNKSMLLSSLGCSGSETSLLNCHYSVPSSSCDKYDIAGVLCEGVCQKKKQNRQNIRLSCMLSSGTIAFDIGLG